MSRLSSHLMNAMPRLLIGSPLHGVVSGRWATLHFTGRRTGRRYHLPVAYVVDEQGADSGGDRIVISTDSGWWPNLVNGETFKLTLRGRRRRAMATRIDGDEAVDALRRLVQLPGYAKAAGVPRRDGRVDESDLVQAASERVVLALSIEDRT